MKLLLIRHAPAHPVDAIRWPDDDERPITREGAGAFLLASRGLAHLVPEVDQVLASPLPRAWQTAGIVHQECGWPEPVLTDILRPRNPADDVIAAIARRTQEAVVAVVGHEPQLSVLLGRFLGAVAGISGLHFTEGGVCCLRFDDEPDEGTGTLLWMATPSMLRRIRRARGLHEVALVEESRAAG